MIFHEIDDDQMKVFISSTGCREKIWFVPPPEAIIGRMIKPLGVRRVQISSSKPPMLDYTCDEHVLNMRLLKAKKWSKSVDFSAKNQRF